MFSLDEAVAKWRAGLSQSDALREEDATELEAHLREQVQELVRVGLTEEEAFGVALSRLGDTERVTAEFAKVNPDIAWRSSVWWMAVGVLSYVVIGRLAAYLQSIGTLVGYSLEWERTSLVMVSLGTKFAVWSGVVWFCFRACAGKAPAEKWLRRRSVYTVALTLALLILVSSILVPIFALPYAYSRFPADATARASLTGTYAALLGSALVQLLLVVAVVRLRPNRLRKTAAE